LTHTNLVRIAYRVVDDLVQQGGASYFNDLLAQGILHDDVAPWVDTDMAAYLLKHIRLLSPTSADQTVDIFTNPDAIVLFNNLMELLEGGMGRDPAVRKQYYSK